MTSAHPPETVIQRSRGLVPVDLREVWRYRGLAYFLVWRDIKVRYKQTALGAAWAILVPVLTMAVFSIFLGALARIPSDGIPYPVFALAALVPWTYFASSVTLASHSVVEQQRLVSKVYFPRILLPIAATLSGLVDFSLAFLVLCVIALAFGVPLSAGMVALPLILLLLVLTGIATSLWLAALEVRFRDIRYAIPFGIQFWMFLSPVAYPASLIPEKWRALYFLNPMAGVIEGFRWAVLGVGEVAPLSVAVSVAAVLVLLVGGALYFRAAERRFADVI